MCLSLVVSIFVVGIDVLQSTAAVEKWEETKKMQKTLEKTKVKLANAESECSKLKSNNEMLKNALERANKAKDSLEKKAYKNAPPLGAAKAAGLQEQELRDQNAQLHNEVTYMKCASQSLSH